MVLEITLSESLRAFELLKHHVPSVDLAISGNRIKIMGDNLEELRGKVHKILEENNIEILRIQIKSFSLEDFFVSILKEKRGG